MSVPSILRTTGLVLVSCLHIAIAASPLSKQMLAAHNSYRAKAGTPSLIWSESLAARAQQWANTLIVRGTYAMRADGPFGENLYEVSGGSSTPAEVVSAWASEEVSYDQATNTCTARCGHYTQVVWRTTKLMGCGVARNARREVWVCDYDPHGNTVGEKPY